MSDQLWELLSKALEQEEIEEGLFMPSSFEDSFIDYGDKHGQ